jgi:SPFH domain, Band 7 family protein
MEIAIILAVIAVLFVSRGIKIVPQQNAWILERLGRYHSTLQPGLNIIIPFIDSVAYKHSLKEIPLDVPSQICITKDNTQLTVDGVLYFQVTDAMRASYGSSNYIVAITQLAQTTLRSVVGKLELDKTFEEREFINHSVVNSLDDAAATWGVKVLRYEIKDLTPPNEILHAMQRQITAEREKRAVIATSEGARQQAINVAEGERQAFIARSEGRSRRPSTMRKAKPPPSRPWPTPRARAGSRGQCHSKTRRRRSRAAQGRPAGSGHLCQPRQIEHHPHRAWRHEPGRRPHCLGHDGAEENTVSAPISPARRARPHWPH